MNASYFDNHGNAAKWPYTLYYSDIEHYIAWAASSLPDGARCLNVGCALFDNYPALSADLEWSACDIDPRCIEIVRERYPDVDAKVCGRLPEYPAGSFDLVFASEVIEHLDSPVKWISTVFETLREGGRMILTTPNYGISMLPVLEYSILEIIARFKGFSRFGIHPNKYTRRKLGEHLHRAVESRGSTFISKVSYSMVLVSDTVRTRRPVRRLAFKGRG